MACEAEKDSYAAALLVLFGASVSIALTPGWVKLGALAAFIGACLHWRAAAQRLADCMRANDLHFEADLLTEHADRLAAEIDYLHSLGVPATA